MSKKKPEVPVTRGRLLAAVENTPEDAMFLVGICLLYTSDAADD